MPAGHPSLPHLTAPTWAMVLQLCEVRRPSAPHKRNKPFPSTPTPHSAATLADMPSGHLSGVTTLHKFATKCHLPTTNYQLTFITPSPA